MDLQILAWRARRQGADIGIERGPTGVGEGVREHCVEQEHNYMRCEVFVLVQKKNGIAEILWAVAQNATG